MKKDLTPERAKFWMDLKEKYNMKMWKTESQSKESLKEELQLKKYFAINFFDRKLKFYERQ